jgi:hypothetical protein
MCFTLQFLDHSISSNILFDSDHCIEIVEFQPIPFDIGESESEIEDEKGTGLRDFSREGWKPEREIQAFASILFEITFGPRQTSGERLSPIAHQIL